MPAERLYYADSHLLSFAARVSDVREYARRDGKQVWQIALDRTAFYPTSGGQPHDTGTLTARARSGAALTLAVEDVVAEEDGEVWHTTAKPLPAGTEVQAEINGARRLDHTQQHTGQHLLSAILADQFQAATVSFHLGAEDTTIDVTPAEDTPQAYAALQAQLPEVERRVNEAIARNLQVHTHSVPGEQARQMLADGELRKLPTVSGDVRIVEIAGLDRNACGGTHVHALGEIGCVLLRETERAKRALRLHFVCGQRAVHAARRDWEHLGAVAAQLSTARGLAAAGVERQAAELRSLAKERQRLLEQLATRHAAQIAAGAGAVLHVDETLDGYDAAYARLLGAALLRVHAHTTALLTTREGAEASVLLAHNVPGKRHCGELLRAALEEHGLRGGGSGTLAQARLPAALLDAVAATLRCALPVGS